MTHMNDSLLCNNKFLENPVDYYNTPPKTLSENN